MLNHRTNIRMRQCVSLLLVASYSNACTGWHTASVAPQALIAERHPDRLRVTGQDHSRFLLTGPAMAGDSLVGTGVIGEKVNGGDSLGHVAMPAGDARTIEYRHVSAGKTTGLALGLAAVGVATFLVVAFVNGMAP